MPLAGGERLGPYEILGKIGAGGMGEVYRARDTRVGRDVAIKVSKDEFSERFEREARAVAALSHANICHLYDVGPNYLVMELVEGESPKGPLPLDDALKIARQIADALEAAHEKGIVHRDLKPGNIKITPDGVAKVLDFGLAKLPPADSNLSSGGEHSPTMTMGATLPGVILGTAAYMSPEQARGKVADKRADIWAFGVVLYELLTGRRPFHGEDVTEILASVVKERPDFSKIPAKARPLLERCLEKDPKKRLRDIGDMDLLLASQAPAARAAVVRGSVPWVVAGAAVLALAALSFLYLRSNGAERHAMRFEIRPPDKVSFEFPQISPDGRAIAFTGSGRLWIRAMDSLEARSVPGTDGATGIVTWSADSQNLAFWTGGWLKRVAASGGPPVAISDLPNAGGASWGPNGVILISNVTGIEQVSEAGGAATPITKPDGNIHVAPQFLPDGKHFLEVVVSGKPEEGGIYVASLDGKPAVRLLPDQSYATYAPGNSGSAGHLLFLRSGTLMAQAFDPGGLRLTGAVFPVAEHVANYLALGLFSISSTGILTYLSGSDVQTEAQVVWKNRMGAVTGNFGPTGGYSGFRLSPDNKRIVYQDAPGTDVWVLDSLRGVPSRLTFDTGQDNFPMWSPDGTRVLWASNRRGSYDLYAKAANGTGEDQLLVKMGTPTGWATDWSRDGRFILYQKPGEKTGQDLWIAPQGTAPGSAGSEPYAFLATQFDERDGRFSPDGKWIAYVSNETGLNEIYVQSFPLSGAKFQVSNGGGTQPQWGSDGANGTELFYLASDRMLTAVPVKFPRSAGESFELGASKPLFPVSVAGGPIERDYQVSRDGQFFLVWGNPGSGTAPPLTVVLNWQAGLK